MSTVTAHTHSAPAAQNSERLKELHLLAGLLRDDPSAWRTFNSSYTRLIRASITRVTGRFSAVVNAEDVHEIHATLCLQLLANDKAKLRSFDPERGNRLSSWLGLLASHAAYDFLRSRRREPRFDEVTDSIPAAGTLDPFTACAMNERARIAAELIATFSDKDRQFIMLYYGEGLAPEQIARRMKISVKTVYSKKHKIQHRLESLLQKRQLAA